MNSDLRLKAMVAVLCCAMQWSCGYDSFGDQHDDKACTISANADLSLLRDKYFGAGYTVNDDFVFEGVVTANDKSQNMFKTFFVQDRSGGVEIMAGLYDLHNTYHVGQRVVINARGLAVDCYNGVMRIGCRSASWSGRSVDYFGIGSLLESHVIPCREVVGVASVNVPNSALHIDLCGRLVSVGGLRLEDGPGATWSEENPYSSYTCHRFVTDDGGSLGVIVSRYADFADRPVPSGRLRLTGILMYGNFDGREGFVLKIRDEGDVEEM